jgi:hypothetical protein
MDILKRFVAAITFGFCLLMSTLCTAQDMATQARMHEHILALYNFHPSKLNDDSRKAKSAEMDKFWNDVKAHQKQELPLLRIELQDSSNPTFFMTDGSELLLQLSNSQEDKALALSAMSKSDLNDTDSGAYFYTIHDLSLSGFDTTKAALHILDYPEFSVPLPMHAMTLDASSCLMYLLLPLDASKWMPDTERRFALEKNETILKALIALFFYAQTSEGDRMIAVAASDGTKSAAVRKDAASYQEDAKQALHQKSDVKGTEAEVRQARKARLRAVSDESIDDVQDMTVRLIQLRHVAVK